MPRPFKCSVASTVLVVHRVAQKREDAVSREVTRKLSEADNRKMSRKEKDERWVGPALSSLSYSALPATIWSYMGWGVSCWRTGLWGV